MDNDITKTDYKGERKKKKAISPLYNIRPTFPDKLPDKLDHCICPQTCQILGGGTSLCKTCTVVCRPKGMDFGVFLKRRPKTPWTKTKTPWTEAKTPWTKTKTPVD